MAGLQQAGSVVDVPSGGRLVGRSAQGAFHGARMACCWPWACLTGYRTPGFLNWLFDRIMALYMPVGGSWPNLRESRQHLLEQRTLAGHDLRAPEEITRSLAQAARAWSRNPAPFARGPRHVRRQAARERMHRLAAPGCMRPSVAAALRRSSRSMAAGLANDLLAIHPALDCPWPATAGALLARAACPGYCAVLAAFSRRPGCRPVQQRAGTCPPGASTRPARVLAWARVVARRSPAAVPPSCRDHAWPASRARAECR